ncbi:hypothetical protein ACJ41P_31765 [Azospirillum argentinense]|uniref:Uncharacterized protein n=1 Tax=Azospirillum argentinense TaxID=2970906 RepID=A0ABW8VHI3_9PROT
MSEVDEALDRLSRYNNGRYHPETNPYGHTGKGGTLANWVRSGKDGVTIWNAMAALFNSINFVTERSAVAEIYRRCQDLVAQITAGSTSALAFPAVDKSLVTGPDIVDLIVYDTRLDDRLPDGSRWNEPGRCSALSYWGEAQGSYRGVKRDFPMVAGIIALQTRILIFDLLDLDPVTGAPRLWASTNAAGNGLISCGSTLPITSITARNGYIYVGTGMGLHIISLTGDWCERYDNGGRRRRLGTIAQRNAVLSEGPVNAAAALPATGINCVRAHVYPGAPLDTAGMPIPTVAVTTSGSVSVIHPTGMVVSITGGAYTGAAFFGAGRLCAFLAGSDQRFEVGPLPYASVDRAAWRQGYYNNGAGPRLLAHIGGTATAVAPGALGTSTGVSLLAEDEANPANGMVANISTVSNTGWMQGDVRLAALCDFMTGSVTGLDMIINGGFDLGIANWAQGTAASISVVAGKMRVASASDAWVIAEQNLPAVVGQTYAVAANANKGTAGSGVVRCWGVEGAPVDRTATSTIDFAQSWQVTAAAAVTTVQLQVRPVAGSAGQYAEFDNISVRPCSADRSYNAVPLTVMGTTPLMRTAVAAGGMVEWSGWSTTAWLEQPFSARLNVGSGPLSMPIVFRAGEGAGAETLVSRDSTPSGARWRLLLTAGGSLQLVASDGTNTATAITSATYRDGTRREVVPVISRSLARLEIWVDGELAATAALGSLGSLDNAAATLRVGLDQQGANPATSCAISMLRVSASEMSPAQIRRSAADMRPVLAGMPIFLAGAAGITALSRCPLSDRLLACTAAGSNVFRGFARTAFHSSANITSTTSNSHKAGSLGGGMLLLGTAAQSAALIDALGGKEALLAGGPRPVARPWTVVGRTIDATPTMIGPRIFVGERETGTAIILMKGRSSGASASDDLTYHRRVDWYRDAGGDVTFRGSVLPVSPDSETTSSCDCTFVSDSASQTIGVRVIGKAAATIAWEGAVTVYRGPAEATYAQ